MTDIEERFPGNGDDGSMIKRELLSRASVKRELRACPTENRVANLTPLRFGRYFNNNDARFIAGRILKRNVKIAVRFDFESNNAARKHVSVILNPGWRFDHRFARAQCSRHRAVRKIYERH